MKWNIYQMDDLDSGLPGLTSVSYKFSFLVTNIHMATF